MQSDLDCGLAREFARYVRHLRPSLDQAPCERGPRLTLPRIAETYTRYSPPKCIGCKRYGVIGHPYRQHISTSYVERQNLTMRMGMRRFTRLTNAFSKKLENLKHAVALHFMHYNFCRKHQTLGTSPAVSAGIADHVWTLAELIGILEKRTIESN